MTQDELNELRVTLQRAQKEFESGRSMVEMLGVLAIIGVLSVTGIAGFKTAMDRHRANELMNEASKRAVVAMAQLEQGRTASQISFSEFTNNNMGHGVFENEAIDLKADPFAFGILLRGLDKTVCKNLRNMGGKGMYVAGTVHHSACSYDENNDLVFLYCKDSTVNCSMPTNPSKCTREGERGFGWTGTHCAVSL